MKKTLRLLVLVVLLAGSVYAGEMPNGVASTPPSPTTNAVQEPVNETQNSQATESIATEILINVLQSLRALF
jgi:hypothetical protein